MKTILIILAVIMLAASSVSAVIPRLMNYQGVLTDDMGVVVSDGPYNMTFRIYDVPSGGTPLWEETFAVNVSKGIFNTILGYTTPIDIDEAFSSALYLALEIEGGGELSPRRIFTANAHAWSSLSVYGVTNIFPAEGNVGIGVLNAEAPLHIYTTITDPNTPTLLIQNEGNHSLIDFKRSTVTGARIRYSTGNDFFFGTLATGGVSLRTNDLTRLRIVGDGKVGIGTVGPLEKLDVNGAIRLGTTAESNEGTLRWTGSDFEGYDGSLWQSLTSGGGTGLPAGTSGQTLRHDGADWAATGNLYNNGSYLGIGTTSPSAPLHIAQTTGQIGLQVDGNNGSWASIYLNASGGGNPMYGYQRTGTIRGYHYLDSGFGWNLILNSDPAMTVAQWGWATFGSAPLSESLNIEGALLLGNTTGSNAGAIRYTGSDFEGYTGGMWRSLTTGGLPAGTPGQTLRYDGGWIAGGPLYNDGSEIGIGTASPNEKLHIFEDVDAWMGIRIENPNAGSGSGEQISFVDENGTLAGIRLYDDLFAGAYSGAMAIYNNRPSGSLLFRTGGQNRMRIMESGDLETYGTAGNRSLYAWNNAVGGNLTAYDETGSYTTVSLGGDGSGEGGFIWVRRNNGSNGFTVDGNHNGSQDTKVGIYGELRSAEFNMNESGDASIELPPDALSASELLDEPGAGYDWRAVVYDLDGGITSVAGRTVTVPAAGYVIVWGTAEVQIDHTIGTADYGRLGVSANETSYPGAQDNDLKLDAGLATGVYNFPVTVHGLFEVTGSGAYSYYLIGSEFSGVVSVNKSSLTALYIPTAYGPVDALSASYGSALSDSDPTLERREAEAFKDARLERELAAMRERIAALENELENK